MFDTSRYFPDGYFMDNYFPQYWWFRPSLLNFVTFARVVVSSFMKLLRVKND